MNRELPPTCKKCETEWKKDEEESGEFHEVYQPACNCYKRDIKLSVG